MTSLIRSEVTLVPSSVKYLSHLKWWSNKFQTNMNYDNSYVHSYIIHIIGQAHIELEYLLIDRQTFLLVIVGKAQLLLIKLMMALFISAANYAIHPYLCCRFVIHCHFLWKFQVYLLSLFEICLKWVYNISLKCTVHFLEAFWV